MEQHLSQPPAFLLLVGEGFFEFGFEEMKFVLENASQQGTTQARIGVLGLSHEAQFLDIVSLFTQYHERQVRGAPILIDVKILFLLTAWQGRAELFL